MNSLWHRSKRRPAFLRCVIIGFIAGLLLAVPSCATPPSTPSLTPTDVFDRTQTVMDQLRSFRVQSTITRTEDGQTTLTSQLIEYAYPERQHVVTSYGGTTHEEILVGEAAYSRTSDDGVWTSRVLQQPGVAWTSQKIKGMDWTAAFRSLLGMVELRDERVDGVDCYRYRGEYDTKAAAEEAIASFPTVDPSDPRYEELRSQRDMMAATMAGMRQTMEFWIGKNDYLVRKVQTDEAGSKFEISNGVTTATPRAATIINRYFDFNSDIEIETPANLETVNLAATLTSAGAGDNSTHFRPAWTITVLNMGTEPATNLRLFVNTSATDKGFQTIEAAPDSSPVTIPPGGTANFTAAWQVDAATMDKKTFVELLTLATVQATWARPDGTQGEKVLLKGGLPAFP